MSARCRPNHVFREVLPHGLALYPFARSIHDAGWLANEEVLAHVARYDGPAVFVDMGGEEDYASLRLSAVLRVYKRVHERGGRLVLCNTPPLIREVFRVVSLDGLPRLEVSAHEVPGGRPPRPDPAWLNWGGGVAGAMLRSFAEGGDLEQMPVLGDALEEAGCAIPDVLEHCRGPGPHARDCWVIHFLQKSKA